MQKKYKENIAKALPKKYNEFLKKLKEKNQKKKVI